MTGLEATVRGCRACVASDVLQPLPHEPRPIFRVSSTARIVIASQAPGARAHASGIPFDDASGERLRAWLGLGHDRFYDRRHLGIVPMGFCFPGYDAAGSDLPPRPECRRLWHDQVFAAMPNVELIVCIGLYAARYHFARRGLLPRGAVALTSLVEDWRRTYQAPGGPRLLVLPHPSWRNTGWLKRHPWFETDVLPTVRAEVKRLTTTVRAEPVFTIGSADRGQIQGMLSEGRA